MEIENDSMNDFSKKVQNEIERYNFLISGKWAASSIENYDQLTQSLVESRISRGLTEEDLARLISSDTDEIERFESQLYRGAPVKVVKDVANILQLSVDESIWESIGIYDHRQNWNPIANYNPKHFQEMFERGWFGKFEGGIEEATQYADVLISHYTLLAESHGQVTHHRRSTSFQNHSDAALLAWEGRIFHKAERFTINFDFYQNISDLNEWIEDLRNLSSLIDGIAQVPDFLANRGVAFVYEPHLPQTYLDGMAAIHPRGFPLIATTCRHDRADNFWFVLFHELGHLALHLDKSERGRSFLDEIENFPPSDQTELEADEFALNSLIPEESWKKCAARFYQTKEMIKKSAESLSISPSIIAGRIRRESGDYSKFTDILGTGSVRFQLRQIATHSDF